MEWEKGDGGKTRVEQQPEREREIHSAIITLFPLPIRTISLLGNGFKTAQLSLKEWVVSGFISRLS